jgi:hypothetical protein
MRISKKVVHRYIAFDIADEKLTDQVKDIIRNINTRLEHQPEDSFEDLSDELFQTTGFNLQTLFDQPYSDIFGELDEVAIELFVDDGMTNLLE